MHADIRRVQPRCRRLRPPFQRGKGFDLGRGVAAAAGLGQRSGDVARCEELLDLPREHARRHLQQALEVLVLRVQQQAPACIATTVSICL